MNRLILNRDFKLPSDDWYQLAPMGEFPHAGSGVVQVVDETACMTMAARFEDEAKSENFAGLLIDFDHFSLDAGRKSEAAGWIVGLEARISGQLADDGKVEGTTKYANYAKGGVEDGEEGVSRNGEENAKGRTPGQRPANVGLWARIRWSDSGEAAVNGGRYRFLSPVWTRSDCVELGPDAESGRMRVRPVRLLNAAVTNDPNLKGMVPLSNRAASALANDENEEERFKWTLGDSPDGRHCPSCAGLSGQVRTMAEWTEAGLVPKSGKLYCKEHCRCSLDKTNEPVAGNLEGVPVRKPPPEDGDGEDQANRSVAEWLADAKRTLRNRLRDEADEKADAVANAARALTVGEAIAEGKRAARSVDLVS